MIACFVLNITIVLAMRQLMAFWNKKRDREFGTEAHSAGLAVEEVVSQGVADETDWKNKHIRYSL